MRIYFKALFTWTSIWSKSGDQGTQWYTATVDLLAYTGSFVQLRFTGFTGSAPNSHRGDMVIDDITITTVPELGGNDGDHWMGSSDSPKINIYPNPAQNYTLIDLSTFDSDEFYISILDVLGKEIYSTTTVDGETLVRIPTDTFAPGSYIVAVRSFSGTMINEKLIIRK